MSRILAYRLPGCTAPADKIVTRLDHEKHIETAFIRGRCKLPSLSCACSSEVCPAKYTPALFAEVATARQDEVRRRRADAEAAQLAKKMSEGISGANAVGNSSATMTTLPAIPASAISSQGSGTTTLPNGTMLSTTGFVPDTGQVRGVSRKAKRKAERRARAAEKKKKHGQQKGGQQQRVDTQMQQQQQQQQLATMSAAAFTPDSLPIQQVKRPRNDLATDSRQHGGGNNNSSTGNGLGGLRFYDALQTSSPPSTHTSRASSDDNVCDRGSQGPNLCRGGPKVRCPLCGPRAQKLYNPTRGLRMHLNASHDLDHETARQTLALAAAESLAAAAAAAISTHPCSSASITRAAASMEEEPAASAASYAGAEAMSSTTDSTSIVKSPLCAADSAATAALTSTLEARTTTRKGKSLAVAKDTSGNAARASSVDDSPVLYAARAGDVETLAQLSNSGIDISSARDRHGSNALHWAAGNGHLLCVKYLLETVGMDPLAAHAARKRDGKTALHWAARNGRVQVIKYLLSAKVGVNQDVPAADGTTPLHLALFGGHVAAATTLRDAGADVAAANSWGCTVAHWAAMGGHVQAAEWVSRIQYTKVQNNDMAWQNMAAFVHSDSSVQQESRPGGQFGGIGEQRLSREQRLARKEIFSQAQNDGQTPLHKAASKGHFEMVRYLVSTVGVNTHCRNASGLTAAEVAQLAGHGLDLASACVGK